MRPADPSAFLANVAPFSELPREEIERLISAGQTMSFRAGESVGQFNQPGDHGLYVIVAGAAVLKAADGRPLEQRGEGELFGHAVRFDGAACNYAVEASEDLELLYLPAAKLADLGRRHPQFARFFSDGPGARLREAGIHRPARLGELPPLLRVGQEAGFDHRGRGP